MHLSVVIVNFCTHTRQPETHRHTLHGTVGDLPKSRSTVSEPFINEGVPAHLQQFAFEESE